MSKSKPWISWDENTGHCSRCGGISIWRSGVTVPSQKIGVVEENLTFFKWRKRFKQTHNKCVDKSIDPVVTK